MLGEQLLSRRSLLREGIKYGVGLVGVSAIAVACDRANTVNVVQEAKFQELGLRGNIQLVDIGDIPAYNNSENGFIVHQKVVKTPEPFSHEETHDFLKFAWETSSETPQVAVSDIRLDRAKWETLPEGSSPFVTFDLAYSAFNSNTSDPSELLEEHLRSAVFHFSQEDLQDFRGDQSLLPY